MAKARASSDTLDTYPNVAPSIPELPVSPMHAVEGPAPALSFEHTRFQYKSAKLLPDDVVDMTIKVEGSIIRPNDRGKEALVSFTISVSPKGKEPWKVEKLYRDDLTLDARIRAAVGKTQSKKMSALLENRLFKNNAPVKADQRKVWVLY